MTARARFKQEDVTRAFRGARAAGIEDLKIEIAPDGRIVMIVGRAAIEPESVNSFDRIAKAG